MKGGLSVPQMFNKISQKYEFLNHLFSFYLDEYWREKAVKLLNDGKILDVATGTGEVIKKIVKNKNYKMIIGIDLSKEMLKKAILNKNYKNVFYIISDAEKLPFKSNSFDSLIIAFGIRNISNRKLALSEFYRVLNENGVLVVLEIVGPENFLKYPFFFYLKNVIPFIANLFTSQKEAYIYLYNSVINFPRREEFKKIIESVGFKNVEIIDLTFGVCTVFKALKIERQNKEKNII